MPKMWMLTGGEAIVVGSPLEEVVRPEGSGNSMISGDNSYMLS